MSNLSLNYTGIGSLPFSSDNAVDLALDFIFKNYTNFPYWPQLPHFKKEEDMVTQFSQNMAGFTIDNGKVYFECEDDSFFEKLEELFFDYEEVLSKDDLSEAEEILDKYEITEPYSNTINKFLKELKNYNPEFVKGSITGAFTFSTSVCDKEGKSAFYDETLRDVIVKTLTLKALWQVKEFKKASKNSTPVIFMDEPSVSQIGSCAFLTVKNEEVVEMLSSISNNIKKYGAIVGIHCCGKTDWEIAINSNVDVINFDAYLYSQSVSLYSDKIKTFLENGGHLAFGIVPTLNEDILKTLDINGLMDSFNNSINLLIKKGISKELIMKQSFLTPSCGCGSLSNEDATKALLLTKELSEKLRGEI